jgi:hypothetical protein
MSAIIELYSNVAGANAFAHEESSSASLLAPNNGMGLAA